MRKFFNQFLIYGLASVLGKIAAVFLLPFYTNVLSKEEYGAMAMIVACKGIIDLFSNLNIHSGVARDYYEKSIERTKLVSTGLFSILLFSFAILFILLTTRKFWVLNILNIPGYEKAFVIMLLTIPAGSLFSYFGILTRYQQKAVRFSIGNGLQLLIQISLTIYFVLALKTGIIGVFYGMLGGEIIGIIYFFLLNKENVSVVFDKKLLWRILRFSLPTLPAILAAWIDSSVGQILIGKYISLEDAGIYSIALRISSIFLLIRVALGNVWNPYVYENFRTPDFKKDVIRLFHTASIILIIISINLAFLADYIVLLLSNAAFIAAYKYLILLSIPMSISILYWFAGIGPGITRKTKYVSYANIAGSAANLVLLFLFLPRFGIITVPITLGISKLISYLSISYYTRREFALSFPLKNIFILITSVIGCYLFKTLGVSRVTTLAILFILDAASIVYLYKQYNLKQFALSYLREH